MYYKVGCQKAGWPRGLRVTFLCNLLNLESGLCVTGPEMLNHVHQKLVFKTEVPMY